jgi:hypothetical protein
MTRGTRAARVGRMVARRFGEQLGARRGRWGNVLGVDVTSDTAFDA